jgi:hypothetical protein
MLEERNQIGIIAIVVDDEASIDRNVAGTSRCEDRVRLAPRPEFGLIEYDIGIPCEQPGGGEAGYPRSDNCNPAPARKRRLAEAGIH